MLFNSIEFAIFLPIVFIIYWSIGSERLKIQNLFILGASYTFYGWWDYRFLILIFISSFADYFIGIGFLKYKVQKKRKLLLITSLVINLGLLGFFKYFNFFIESFNAAFTLFGAKPNFSTIQILLPIGISFYTFQTLSYTIDIYRNKIKPTTDYISFFAYVSFFPQLVAGPIERARNLLPQFIKPRVFDYNSAKDGMRQILWGLFKKIVVADTCALYVNDIYQNFETANSSLLFLGAFYFMIQIYGDFSGYSDIAIGTGRLFGFNLMQNFNYPLFARNTIETWKNWHISLNTWFVEYVYVPLGGSQKGTKRTIINIFIVFLISGFWHGASGHFIVWGLVCAIQFVITLYFVRNSPKLSSIVAEGKTLPSLKEFIQIFFTQLFIILSLILFRSKSIDQALVYFNHLFSFNIFPLPIYWLDIMPQVLILLTWEWFHRTKKHGLMIEYLPRNIRWLIYIGLTWSILYYFGEEQEYIYFQF